MQSFGRLTATAFVVARAEARPVDGVGSVPAVEIWLPAQTRRGPGR
jgi:hypothetical protein